MAEKTLKDYSTDELNELRGELVERYMFEWDKPMSFYNGMDALDAELETRIKEY